VVLVHHGDDHVVMGALPLLGLHGDVAQRALYHARSHWFPDQSGLCLVQPDDRLVHGQKIFLLYE
jgi:hypothetical protein